MPIKKTHEQFLKDLKKVNENIIVLGMYVNGKTPILCKCKKKKCTYEEGVFCYVYNMDIPECSEYGDCFFKRKGGGFARLF